VTSEHQQSTMLQRDRVELPVAVSD